MTSALKPWLVLALIFIAGALSGAALTMVIGSRLHHPPGADQMSKHIMMRLTQELSLTSDQQGKIHPIIVESAKELHEVHLDEVRRVSQIIKLTNEQLAPILTSDQKTELDKLIAQGENSFSGHSHNWGWGPAGDKHPAAGPPNGNAQTPAPTPTTNAPPTAPGT